MEQQMSPEALELWSFYFTVFGITGTFVGIISVLCFALSPLPTPPPPLPPYPYPDWAKRISELGQ